MGKRCIWCPLGFGGSNGPGGLMRRARIEYGGGWDASVLEQEFGMPPRAVPAVLSPVFTVDGLVEPDATAWLAHVHARTGGTQTARSHAECLQRFAAFL